MNFPSGERVSLPPRLLNPGLSGSRQVHPPEPPVSLSRINDAALMRLGEDLAKLMEGFASEEKQGGLSPSLREYVELLEMQVTEEVLRRCF